MPYAQRFRRFLLFASLSFLLGGTLAFEASAGGKISIQLTQVLATERGGSGPKQFDPSLHELKSQLEKYSYRVFKNVGTEKKEVGEGEEVAFTLSGEPGFTAKVKSSILGNDLALDLVIVREDTKKEVMTTRLKSKDGGTSLVGKELDKKNGHLFLAFTVKKG